MTLLPWLRSLSHARALSAAVVLTIAIGVAVLTTAFGVVNAALWRQPPFDDAARLTLLNLVRNPEGEPQRRERWSYARLTRLHQQQKSFDRTANYTPSILTLAGDAHSETLRSEMVSASYFQVLRVNATIGRTFTVDEDNSAQPTAVALVSPSLVRRQWPTAPNVVGRTLRLNGVVVEIIGVMPEGFRGISGTAELWGPATLTPRLTYAEYVTTNQNFISVVGRLRDDVNLEDAQAELAVLGATINRELPSNPRQPDERVTATARTLNDARVDPTVRRSLRVLFVAVVLLHLLACANVVNLLLGRAAARRREAAVRVALGSSNGRLFGHLLGEGLVLGIAGSVLGVALAWAASSVVTPPTNMWAPRNFYGSISPFDSPAFGMVEFGFGIALAMITALVVAMPPALSAFGIDVVSGIRAGARGMTGRAFSLRRPSARGVIVGIEAALAVLLVMAGGLLIDSYGRMREKELGLGVDPRRVLTFWVIPSEARYPPSKAPAFVARLLETVKAVPGVDAATVDGGGPLSGTASSTLYVAGRAAPAPGQAPPVLRHYVAPDHFDAMGIPVLRGRVFTTSDIGGSPKVTVISESAAKKFWPNEDPIGQRVWFGGGSSFNGPDSAAEIVGIVGDVVYAPLDQRPNPSSFYTSFAQFTYAPRMVFLRTQGNPLALIPDVRKALAAVDPDISMRDVQLLSDIMNGSWARNRFDAFLFGGFGVAALLLAASGIFAVLAYAVANRTREFGIRLALGASAPSVVGLVIREGLAFPVIGFIVGIAASAAATRLIRSSLFEVSPLEPRVFAATVLLLLVTAVAACIAPAVRATRADPIEALRAD
jgi:putative ABC transport system permease protein